MPRILRATLYRDPGRSALLDRLRSTGWLTAAISGSGRATGGRRSLAQVHRGRRSGEISSCSQRQMRKYGGYRCRAPGARRRKRHGIQNGPQPYTVNRTP
jgi:hypothetical protein